MDNIDEQNLRHELIRLSEELLRGARDEKLTEELEEIRQKISAISFALSCDTRKIHDIH